MTIQQANFVKLLKNRPLHEVAELFYGKFGKTEYCEGPESVSETQRGGKRYSFSNFQGNDLKMAASIILREKL